MKFRTKDRKYNGDSVKSLLGSTSVIDRKILNTDGAPLVGMGQFLKEQLTFIIPEILKQEFPAMPALQIFDADNSGTYDQLILTRKRIKEGKHKPVHQTSSKAGRIEVSTNFNGMLVVDYEGNSEYSYKALQKAKQLGENIDADVIEAHNESYNEIADETCFKGISGYQTNNYTEGIANSSLIPAGNKLTSTINWATATGNDIVEDLLSLYNQIGAIGGGNALWLPNTVILSPKDFLIVKTKNFSVTGFSTSETVMSYMEKQYGLKFWATNHLINMSAAGNTDRIIMCNSDKRNAVFHIPRPLEFYPLEARAGKFQLTSAFSIAGVNLRQASTFGYLDRI